MAFDEQLAERIKNYIAPIKSDFVVKKMFGGLCFLYKGKMAIGIVKNQLMVRVISEKYESSLEEEYVAEMDFTGKSMKNFVYVSQDGLNTEEQLSKWIELGIEHAKSVLK
jgi:TfoX/Sxy family transcriptional regulator of competence genes